MKKPGKSVAFEYRLLHKTGDWIWCEGTLTNMLLEPGVNALVSNFRDISLRKLAEQQKEFDKNNLYALINNTPDLMWSIDTDFRLITSNKPWNTLIKTLHGRDVSTFSNILEASFTPEESARYRKYYERAFSGESFTEVEYSALPVEYWHEVSFQPILRGGDVVGTACHSRNITNIKKGEQQLRHNEAFNRGVLNALTAHIAVIDSTGRIVAVNDAWTRFVLENGETTLHPTGVDSNYFAMCQGVPKEDIVSAQALQGIKAVMHGDESQFYLEYPCQTGREHWFGMRAVRFQSDQPMIVLANIDISERKQATDQLLTTSNMLQSALSDMNRILDSSLDVICAVDEKGRFLQVSAACESIWGYKAEELIGQVQMDYVYRDDLESTRKMSASVKGGVNITNFENRFIRKDGSLVTIVWSARWDPEDKIRYAVARDATDKKRSEKAFDVERQRFNELFLQAPSCIGVLKGADHICEMANPLFLKLIGKKNIIGKTLKQVLPELEEQGFHELLDTVYNEGNTFSDEEMMVMLDRENDGSLVNVFVNLVIQPYINKEGNVEGVFFFAIDVTEQVVSRQLLRERERRFQTLSEKTTDMTALTNLEGDLLYASPSITKTLGYSQDELLFKPVYLIIHPDDPSGDMTDLVRTPGKSLFFQQRMHHKLGYWVWCEGVITNMLHEPGVNALVTNFRDISERKLADSEREKMISEITKRNKILEQYTYIVSHNLRAPIAKILGLASIMESESEENQFLIDKVVEETINLDNVVKDMNTIVSARKLTRKKWSLSFFNLSSTLLKIFWRLRLETPAQSSLRISPL